MQSLSIYTSINTVLTKTVNDTISDITNYTNQRMNTYYHEIEAVDDFDIRMMIHASMKNDIISKIKECGKTIVDVYRNITDSSRMISESTYHLSFLIESEYASLCISETEDQAKTAIHSMIDTINSFLLILENKTIKK